MSKARKFKGITTIVLGVVLFIVSIFNHVTYCMEQEQLDYERKQPVVNNEWWKIGIIEYEGKYYQYRDQVTTYLVMGIDKMGPVEVSDNWYQGGQSDVMFLVIQDPAERKVSLLAINRNSMVDIELYTSDHQFLGMSNQQICLAHGYGDGGELSNKRAMEAVSRLLNGVPVDGFVSVNKGAIEEINHALGGVEIEIPYDMEDPDNKISFKQGETVKLTDLEAFSYITWRDKADLQSAAKRLERQKQYIKNAYNQAIYGDNNKLMLVYDIYTSIPAYVDTNLNVFDALSMLIGYDIDTEHMYQMESIDYVGETGLVEAHIVEESKMETLLKLFYKEVNIEME